MRVEIHIHHHHDRELERRVAQVEVQVMAKAAEALALIAAQNEKIRKIGSETDSLKAKVAELQAAVDAAGDNVPDSVIEALGGVTEQLQTVDDKVQDAQPTDPEDGG